MARHEKLGNFKDGLPFLVIQPFEDGQKRLSRCINLIALLISLNRLSEKSVAVFYGFTRQQSSSVVVKCRSHFWTKPLHQNLHT